MSWARYEAIRELHDRGDYDGALQRIAAERSSMDDIWSYVAVSEASCYDRKGESRKALEILEQADQRRTDNFWVYYQLGALYRNLGMRDASFQAYRKGHTILGWHESEQNGYTFTHDFFSPNISTWTKWFDELITVTPIRCLEIGSWQGGSATWLLDKIVSRRRGLLTCVDTFEGSSEHAPWIREIGDTIESIFDRNIRLGGHSAMCRKIIGKSQDVLPAMWGEKFDFIYIDGAHEARFVIQDAVLSWGLLSTGGFLLFDDVDYEFRDHPEQNTIHAIECFTRLLANEIEIVFTGRQMLIRKKIG